MSQDAAKSTCTKCKKDLLEHLEHHSLGGVNADGMLSINCHPEPVAKTDFILKRVIEDRNEKRRLKAEILQLQKDQIAKLENTRVVLERDYGARLDAEAAKRTAESVVAIEVEHKKALAEGEKTRAILVNEYDAKVLDLQGHLKEVRGDNQALRQEKTEIAAKLGACEQRNLDLHLEIGDLKADLEAERRHHEGLKAKTKDMLHLAFTLGKRVVVLERKLGIDDAEAVDELFAKLTGQNPPDGVEELAKRMTEAPAPAVATVPAPPPAPKASVAAPPPQAEAFTLDEDDDGHSVDDDLVIAQDDAEDEESSDAACCGEGCKKPVKVEMSFVMKDGTDGLITACDAVAHADAFYAYLKQAAKTPPASPGIVIGLFNEIDDGQGDSADEDDDDDDNHDDHQEEDHVSR